MAQPMPTPGPSYPMDIGDPPGYAPVGRYQSMPWSTPSLRKDGLNHNILVSLNNFRIGLSRSAKSVGSNTEYFLVFRIDMYFDPISILQSPASRNRQKFVAACKSVFQIEIVFFSESITKISRPFAVVVSGAAGGIDFTTSSPSHAIANGSARLIAGAAANASGINRLRKFIADPSQDQCDCRGVA